MTEKIGFIGVGHFAGFLVEGIRKKSSDTKIILSQRNKVQASVLASKFNCSIAVSNQKVVDEADILLICVRPDIFVDAVQPLHFKEGQTVISVVSGISVETITNSVAPAKAIRALPISSAAINQSPTLMIPDDQHARLFLEFFGKVYVMENEASFNSAAAYSALYGWMFRLLDEAADWGGHHGLEKEKAVDLLCDVMSGASAMIKKDQHLPMKKMVESLATKGGITELGLNIIDQKEGFNAWHAALDAVYKRLTVK